MDLVSIIVPLLMLSLIGFVCVKRQLLTQAGLAGLSKITLTLFIPALLFLGMAKAELSLAALGKGVLAYYLPLILLFLGVFWLFKARGKSSALYGLTSSYGNAVLVGLPIIQAVWGEAALSTFYAILVLHSLVLFFLSGALLARFGEKRRNLSGLILSTLKNPLIGALMLGVLVNLSGISLYAELEQGLGYLAQAGLPCALIVLGASVASMKASLSWDSLVMIVAKLLVLPAMVLLSSCVVGLSELETRVLVVMAACPIGVNVHLYATSQGVSSQAINSAILLSTVLCVMVLPMWVLVLT